MRFLSLKCINMHFMLGIWRTPNWGSLQWSINKGWSWTPVEKVCPSACISASCSSRLHFIVVEGALSLRNTQTVEYHEGKPLYLCTKCPMKFRKPSILKRHMHVHRTYTCGVCSQTFEDVQSLNEHKRNHAKDKDYACAECGMNEHS